MHFVDFVMDAEGREIELWADADTGEFVSECTTCRVEGVCTDDEVRALHFQHAVWCPFGLRIVPREV